MVLGAKRLRVINRGEMTRGDTTRGGNVLGAKRLVTLMSTHNLCFEQKWKLSEFLNQCGHALWKTGKMVKKIPCREKSRNLKFCWKSGKNQRISKNLIFIRSKYSNFIAVQMWLLVVSFCHMLKIPADLILLKGWVLVRWRKSQSVYPFLEHLNSNCKQAIFKNGLGQSTM